MLVSDRNLQTHEKRRLNLATCENILLLYFNTNTQKIVCFWHNTVKGRQKINLTLGKKCRLIDILCTGGGWLAAYLLALQSLYKKSSCETMPRITFSPSRLFLKVISFLYRFPRHTGNMCDWSAASCKHKKGF
jgi:hypothetical protein